ncbi:unnamed protein product [Schistocephalus solidus]|uniref:Uncharacterized protein n=1 Tax=Schistocephalus solidus TaxID=70667 RepID=A0A183TSS5_SCHSO|nr:unnamed protein product [Schistocephalus solidus]
MPDLPGLDYITGCATPCVAICISGHGQFNPISSAKKDTEYRSTKNNFHALKNCVEPGFGLSPTSTPPIEYTESGLVVPRPRVVNILESSEKDNSEDHSSNVDMAVHASRFVSLLVDRHKDA